jgi:ribosomal protein S18 acetylase RimI-like enzyme
MNVRVLVATDALEYRGFMLQGYAQDADAFTTTAEERSAEPLSWWLKRISDPNGLSQAFGAFHEGVLVGSVTIEYSAKYKIRHKAIIVGMFVSAPHRGLGVGRALLLAAISHARARPGVKVLTLTVTEGNTQAVRLYSSAGFRQFGFETIAILTGSEYKSKVHMQLQLSPNERRAA